ncbi:hypothetical protein B14911_23960 [Bacillus sp. NRRL B-14911]|uniref:Uncharacterized protein n=1 Tax=Bacillus infantis NRRL B-14911 TaxID=1367477 RepID=U5LEK6_9BACI|nr:hypothetical protein N288_20030 [Bacillus infantis NRRL B-14911]EAR64696.1 hypothetical protein B14911_23960 [Bacillus sp. NRRL B-14911]
MIQHPFYLYMNGIEAPTKKGIHIYHVNSFFLLFISLSFIDG